MLRRRFAVAVLVALLGALGCGPGKERLYRVSGTVTYNGKPVPRGLIFFDPDGGGVQGFAEITEGQFDTAAPSKGQGVAGGGYTVRVSGFDGKAGNEAPFGQPLFLEHQERRELPKQDSELELKLGK